MGGKRASTRQNLRKIKKGIIRCLFCMLLLLAEKEGFEPPEPFGSTVFKTAAIDRSAISPGAKVNFFSFHISKFYHLLTLFFDFISYL